MRAALAVFLATLLAPGAAAQTAAPPGSVTTTVEVTILTLDVLAIDSKDRPVYDLVADDFEVRVGGKAQPIEGFEPPVKPGAASPRPSPDAAPERIAGTTLPFKPGGPPPLRILLYIDMEELPLTGIREAGRAGLEYARFPAGAPHLSLVTFSGIATTRLWDETTIDHMVNELESLGSTPMALPGDPSVVTGGYGRTVSSGGDARGWDQRQRLETALVENVLTAEASRNRQLIDQAYAAFSEYLRNERIRVRESIRELRAVCERFAPLGDRRHLVLFSQGYERIPGMNAVQYLKAAQDAQRRGGGAPIQTTSRGGDFIGSMPAGLGGRLVFNNSPVTDMDDLEAWLAASGVTLHFIDTSRGSDMTTAEHGAVAASRDRRADHRNLQDGGTRLADSTGGLIRLYGGDLGTTLGGVATAAAQTYRIAVRLTNVDIGKPYSIKVAVKKNGLKARARRTFVAEAPAAQRAKNAAQIDLARQSVGRARAEEKAPGAARASTKPIALAAEWKGKKGPNPSDPDHPFYKVDVSIPYDDVRFVPEEDSMVASLKVVIKAASTSSPWNDTFTEDIFLSLTGPEYSAAAGKDYVKSITLPLPPGTYDLTLSVNDVLENSFGLKQLRVDAEK